ncbi:MAG TPA: sugar efflux transporter [Polyangiaceae bacterium]|nr:sugar efflux transporter [Polyangiaceae bacterium]
MTLSDNDSFSSARPSSQLELADDSVAAEPVAADSGLSRIFRAARMLVINPEFRVILVCNVLMGLGSSFVMPFQSMWGTLEVGMSLRLFGVFMTVTAIANMAISTVVSQRSDTRYSRRSVLLTGAASAALGYLGYAVIRELWVLFLIGSLLLGLASVTFSQLFAYARELVNRSSIPPSEAPLYMSTFRMCFALSWTVGPAIASMALAHLSYVGLFGGAALLYLALYLMVLWRIPKSAAPERPPVEGVAPPIVPMSQLLKVDMVLSWFIALALLFTANTISMGNMSLYVMKVLGGTERHVGIIFSLAPVFEIPLMLYFGLLATRTDSAKLIRISALLAVLYYFAVSLVHAPWQIYPLQILSAAIVSVTSGVAISFFQNMLPHQSGAATNLYVNAMRVGSTSGYLLFGTLAARFGHRGTYSACAALSLASLFMMFIWGRSRSRLGFART